MSYVYIQTEPKLWTVGHYQSDGKLYPESDHATPEAAAERVAYLNGGFNRVLQAQRDDLLKSLKHAVSSAPLRGLPLALEKDIQSACHVIQRIEREQK